jgi:hypothetical protein
VRRQKLLWNLMSTLRLEGERGDGRKKDVPDRENGPVLRTQVENSSA